MRDLGNTAANKAIIRDGISGSEIELTYRTPLASEIQQYYSDSIRRIGGRSESNTVAARIALANSIITGIRDGDFAVDGKAISSDPTSENYYEGWKTLLKEKAADILDTFILATVDGSRVRASLEGGAEEKAELPLPKS